VAGVHGYAGLREEGIQFQELRHSASFFDYPASQSTVLVAYLRECWALRSSSWIGVWELWLLNNSVWDIDVLHFNTPNRKWLFGLQLAITSRPSRCYSCLDSHNKTWAMTAEVGW
jgi:hypothetical protein